MVLGKKCVAYVRMTGFLKKTVSFERKGTVLLVDVIFISLLILLNRRIQSGTTGRTRLWDASYFIKH